MTIYGPANDERTAKVYRLIAEHRYFTFNSAMLIAGYGRNAIRARERFFTSRRHPLQRTRDIRIGGLLFLDFQ